MNVKPLKPALGTMLIPGDIHFDQHDPPALNVMLRVAADVGINAATLIGDTFESTGISRHGRPARNFRFGRGTIKAEEKAARPYIETIAAIVRANREADGGLYMLSGNHEAWWAGVQDEFPGLLDTPWFELYGDLFNGWRVFAEHTALKFGPLLVAHGHRLRGSLSRHSAASVLGNYPGQNTLYGHTHRMDGCITPTVKYGRPVQHGAWSIGHMKSIRREREDRFSGPLSERHQQGFALVSFFTVNGETRFDVNLVPIMRDNHGAPYAVVAGKVYI